MALTQMIPSQWLRRTGNPAVTNLTTRPTSLAGSDDPFVRMHETMDRLFDSFFNDAAGWGVNRAQAEDGGIMNLVTPQLDIAETDTAYVLSIDLPGIDGKDIELSADEDMLTLRAERKRQREQTDDSGVRFHRLERSVGRFERSLSLPVDADSENISAEFNNGVLEITVPRRDDIESARGRRIEIKGGASGSGD